MRLAVVPSTPEDAFLMGFRLRKADRDEVAAVSGRAPVDALLLGIERSEDPMTILHRNAPIAMFGIVDMGGGVGSPWLLGTDDIADHRWEFLRRSKAVLAEHAKPFSLLTNYVDDRNHLHKRWLRWLGFDFVERVPYGILQLPFWRFESCVTR